MTKQFLINRQNIFQMK